MYLLRALMNTSRLNAGMSFGAQAAGSAAGPQPRSLVPQPFDIQEEIVIQRRMIRDVTRVMPDGYPVNFWAFEDPSDAHGRSLHSPLIRLHEGQKASITLETCGGNGGLPQRSTYQWHPLTSGTWFYQSHAGTPVDFEMGLYGVSVVNPPAAPGELQRVYAGGPYYDVERILVFDDVDPSWHVPSESVADDAKRYQTFNPKYFLINDVPSTEIRYDSRVAVEAYAGQTVLLRLMNASFSLVTVSMRQLDSHIVSIDGHPVASADRPWARWIPVKGGQGILLATASRHDLLLNLSGAGRGEYEITIEFQDRQRRVRNRDASHPAHIGRAVTTLRVL